MKQPLKRKFYDLDALNIWRILAAIGIVIFHYNKLTGTAHTNPAFPYYNLLENVYVHGGYFVELFFLISGFCFFKFYSSRIIERKISLTEFMKRRLCKLYPLYIVTTILTVIMQLLYMREYGNYFEEGINVSVKYILLNVFMIGRGWYENTTYPYNAPAWFLSVLLMMYLLFFGICWIAGYKKKKRIVLYGLMVCLCIAGIFIQYQKFQYALINVEMGRGMTGFFLGGVLYFVIEKQTRCNRKKRMLLVTSIYFLLMTGIGIWKGELLFGNVYYVSLVLFPTTLCMSVMCEGLGKIGKIQMIKRASEMTYEIYLIQYPYFIFFKMLGDSLRWDFYSREIWSLFFLGLLAICFVAYFGKRNFLTIESRVHK